MKLISGLANIPSEACDQTGRAYTEPVYLLPKVLFWFSFWLPNFW